MFAFFLFRQNPRLYAHAQNVKPGKRCKQICPGSGRTRMRGKENQDRDMFCLSGKTAGRLLNDLIGKLFLHFFGFCPELLRLDSRFVKRFCDRMVVIR